MVYQGELIGEIFMRPRDELRLWSHTQRTLLLLL